MQYLTYLYQHAGDIAEAALAILGALSYACHKFNANGAAAVFDKIEAPFKYVQNFFSKPGQGGQS